MVNNHTVLFSEGSLPALVQGCHISCQSILRCPWISCREHKITPSEKVIFNYSFDIGTWTWKPTVSSWAAALEDGASFPMSALWSECRGAFTGSQVKSQPEIGNCSHPVISRCVCGCVIPNVWMNSRTLSECQGISKYLGTWHFWPKNKTKQNKKGTDFHYILQCMFFCYITKAEQKESW